MWRRGTLLQRATEDSPIMGQAHDIWRAAALADTLQFYGKCDPFAPESWTSPLLRATEALSRPRRDGDRMTCAMLILPMRLTTTRPLTFSCACWPRRTALAQEWMVH